MPKTLTTVVIDTDGSMLAAEGLTEVPDLASMQKAVGGYLEAVPYFDMFDFGEKPHKCVALCDEEGKLKGYPVNVEATVRWNRCLEGKGVPRNTDVLVGRVLVIFGHPDLMAEL